MEIKVEDITTKVIDGTGAFDALMMAVNAQLQSQFDAGRIRGAEYAQVYLGSMQNAMQMAIQFVLGVQEADWKARLLEKQVLLTAEKYENAKLEGEVLSATVCKLNAEFDLLGAINLKTQEEIALLAQKIVTEKAQTQSLGIDPDSVVGKQKVLYQAQADGYKRDAEQKAATLMVGSWNTRRMTDEAVSANADNLLDDPSIGRIVAKLLAGINA